MKSEQLLDTWCYRTGWLCERIPEESARTPDYRITIAGTQLNAEVKEIVANEEEGRGLEQLSTRGWADPFDEEPGKTIREKIKESHGQIKRFTEVENCSGVLVLLQQFRNKRFRASRPLSRSNWNVRVADRSDFDSKRFKASTDLWARLFRAKEICYFRSEPIPKCNHDFVRGL